MVAAVAAVALADGLELYTCHPSDFVGIDGLNVIWQSRFPERRSSHLIAADPPGPANHLISARVVGYRAVADRRTKVGSRWKGRSEWS
ncbi:hypothetical protein BH24ACT15_BH24ACT15_31940 [soil metagenome]